MRPGETSTAGTMLNSNAFQIDARGAFVIQRAPRAAAGRRVESAGVAPIDPPPPPAPPRVSIGVPVYNGERYLARTLDALLSQTFRSFEIIISDNGSTDGTERICRRYLQRDARIRYYRFETNQGVVRNFNRCFNLARGKYFRWNAADDTCAPTLLEKLVEVLEKDPTVVVAFGRSLIIDDRDRPIRIDHYNADADDPRPHVRFGRLININHRRHCAQEIYGLMRSEALRRTPLYEPVARTDSILLARLSLLGRFRCVDEPLFYNREHPERSVRLVPGERARTRSRLSRWIGTGPIPPAEFWDPQCEGRIVFPEWRILREYSCATRIASMSPVQRALCKITLGLFIVRHARKLVRDLLIAAEHFALGRPQSGSRQPVWNRCARCVGVVSSLAASI